MEWYQIIPIVLSVLTFFGLGSFFSLLIKERHERRLAQSQQERDRLKREKQEEMREVIREEIRPLKEDFAKLKEVDEIQKKSIQAILRDRLYDLASKAAKHEYTTINERVNFENLYTQYHQLGKNGVMDKIRDEYFAYPTEERYNAEKQSKEEKQSKKILVE